MVREAPLQHWREDILFRIVGLWEDPGDGRISARPVAADPPG